MVITLLGEDLRGSSPSQADLTEWADAYGCRHPVLSDPGFGVGSRFVAGWSIGLPSTSLWRWVQRYWWPTRGRASRR